VADADDPAVTGIDDLVDDELKITERLDKAFEPLAYPRMSNE
jgi:hypothetical protein